MCGKVYRVRKLTFEERMTWGECPVCHAKDGERCSPDVGLVLGRTVDGGPPPQGVHIGRLDRAPLKVGVVAVE